MKKLVITRITETVFHPKKPYSVTVTTFDDKGNKEMDIVYPPEVFEGEIEIDREVHFSMKEQ